MGKILIIENNTYDAKDIKDRLKEVIKDPREAYEFFPDLGKDDLGFSTIAIEEYDVVLLDQIGRAHV